MVEMALVMAAPPTEPDTKVEMADEMTEAVKPQGLFDNTYEEEPPDWDGDEPTGVDEDEQEDTPTVAPDEVVAKGPTGLPRANAGAHAGHDACGAADTHRHEQRKSRCGCNTDTNRENKNTKHRRQEGC